MRVFWGSRLGRLCRGGDLARAVSLGLDWKFADGWTLKGGPEYRFNQQWAVRNSGGGHKRTYDPGDAFGGSLSLCCRFRRGRRLGK